MTSRDWFYVVGLLGLASLVPVVWAIVDVTRRPPWQFSMGRKLLWALALGVGWLIVWPFALVASLVYLTSVRRRFADPRLGGSGPAGPYAGGAPPTQPPPPQAPLPPAAWYPDPAGGGGERWWDGRGWTDHRR